MIREEAKKFLPIIQAFAEGKTIETYSCSGMDWVEANNPSFSLCFEYRVKPESKYRPFNSKEECWNEMLKHKPFGWVTDGDSNYCTSIIDGSIVMIGDYEEYTWSRSYENALKALKFIDGTPFGIKE